MWIICLADDSHEMSRLFSEKKKKKKMLSAAVVIGTLKVNAQKQNMDVWC